MLMDEMKRSYRQWRQWGYGAAESLAKARADKVTRYPSTGGDTFGAEFDKGLRWIERPAAAGLRFVGFADEVAPRRVEHTGWFTSEHGDTGETLRGAVYQLPARGGRPVYVAAYQEIGFGVDGAAAIALGELFYGERDDGNDVPGTAARDAASRADRIAEIQAEESRHSHASWQAGARWQDAGETIAATRRDALALLAEMRPLKGKGSPAICAALRDRLDSMLETICAARAKRAELESGYWKADAFNDAAGAAVI